MRDFIAKISPDGTLRAGDLLGIGCREGHFEANSPLTVAVGEPFRVEFALNAQPEPGSFKAPSFEGFDVIAGPAEAQGQSIQIVNNSMTRVVNYTITYVLVPQGAGNVTVGAAEVTVEGTTYRTKPLAIEVVR
ncbi:MAG: BatD family protein [Alistipes onderdonkii]